MIKNIIFSGGGLKGWAYIGTLRALEELICRKNLEQVIGVSIGSIFSLCYILDIKWDFLLDFIMKLNFKEIIDTDINDILLNQSLIAGNIFSMVIKEIISTKIDPDITFNELRRYTNIIYTVNAFNLSKNKIEYFNYKLTPDVKIIDAIRASTSVPLLFPAYLIGLDYYYDGGICNNCPIDMVDELCTIAFDLGKNEKSNIKIIDLFNCLVDNINKKPENAITFKVLDSKFNNQQLNINQSRDDIFNIYMSGYNLSKSVLFDNFIALKTS